MKILIVDDDPGTLNALKANLTSVGHEVTVAVQGRQALKLIKTSSKFKRPFDLLVTDFKMPGLNGMELIRKAKGSIPPLSCILMTAFGNGTIRKTLAHMPNCNYLEKPFTPDELIRLLRHGQKSQKTC